MNPRRLYQVPRDLARELVLRASARLGVQWGQLSPGNLSIGLTTSHYLAQVYCSRTPGKVRWAHGVKVSVGLGRSVATWHREPK